MTIASFSLSKQNSRSKQSILTVSSIKKLLHTHKLAWLDNCKKQNALKLVLPVRTQHPLSQSATNDHVSPTSLFWCKSKRGGMNSSPLLQQRKWWHSQTGKQDIPSSTISISNGWLIPRTTDTTILYLTYSSVIVMICLLEEKVHNIQPGRISPRPINYSCPFQVTRVNVHSI